MKVFALYSVNAGTSPEQLKPHMPQEVPATLKLYLDGRIEQFWFRDGTGPIFLMNVDSLEHARTLLGNLPLVAANAASFELMPVGPLKPLGLLLPGA